MPRHDARPGRRAGFAAALSILGISLGVSAAEARSDPTADSEPESPTSRQHKVESQQSKIESEQQKVESRQLKIQSRQTKIQSRQTKIQSQQSKIESQQLKVEEPEEPRIP